MLDGLTCARLTAGYIHSVGPFSLPTRLPGTPSPHAAPQVYGYVTDVLRL